MNEIPPIISYITIALFLFSAMMFYLSLTGPPSIFCYSVLIFPLSATLTVMHTIKERNSTLSQLSFYCAYISLFLSGFQLFILIILVTGIAPLT